jgi:hypothetical protein
VSLVEWLLDGFSRTTLPFQWHRYTKQKAIVQNVVALLMMMMLMLMLLLLDGCGINAVF